MFKSTGTLHFDPLRGSKHHDPWWCLLQCDEEIARYYAWHLLRYGLKVHWVNLWGVHVSVIKGEPSDNVELWGALEGTEMSFEYEGVIRYDNGKHAWIDIYSLDLSEFRKSFGLSEKSRYHLTVGRLDHPFAIEE